MKNYLFFVEGNQDIALLYRILKDFLSFTEIKNSKIINEPFEKLVNKPFPFKKNSLNIFNEIPTFFQKEEKQICIINANGETNLLFRLDKFFDSTENDNIENIEKFVIFADGDLKNKEDKIVELKNYVEVEDKKRRLTYIKNDSFKNGAIDFKVGDLDINVDIFIFPNNEASGRIENILLENLKKSYNALYSETVNHFENLENKKIVSWSNENSDKDKAFIGCIGNIIVPSASNVTLISNKEFKWFDSDNVTKNLSTLIAFLKNVLGEN